ncbi:MAG: hypothetical protein NT009_13775 [Proteobacteria bacterium]|nr:hypothetical protein [Pseudomonadota bacterium]
MMSPKVQSKIIAAIVTAVASYLQAEEQACRAELSPERPGVAPSLWGSSGRAEMMQMRMLWQRRIVSR